MFLSSFKKLSGFPIAGMFTPLYKKVLKIYPVINIYFELPKIKLSYNIKITIIAFRNKNFSFFHLRFSSLLTGFFHFIFFGK